jgi:hypothetical protein
MKNKVLAVLSLFILGCSTQVEQLEPGDFVFYRYSVFQGDSLIMTHTPNPEDSAQTFLEDPMYYAGKPFDQALMQQLPKAAVGQVMKFPVGESYLGQLEVLQHIPRRDYPAHIEAGKKRKAAFESMLERIKDDMDRQKVDFKSRAPAVSDSLQMLISRANDGSLGNFGRYEPGVEYLVIREGPGVKANKSSSWTWVHFCAATLAGEILLNTYESNPLVVNRRGALLAPWIEPSVVRFHEGSVVLLKIPYTLAFGESANLPLKNTADIYVLLEILRVNNM